MVSIQDGVDAGSMLPIVPYTAIVRKHAVLYRYSPGMIAVQSINFRAPVSSTFNLMHQMH